MQKSNAFCRLMLITHCQLPHTAAYLNFIEQCAQAGISSLQLRQKNQLIEHVLALGYSLKKILKPYNIPLIINDNIELALQLDAEGVHLGQADARPEKALELLGENKIIGLSVESVDQLYEANKHDYLSYVAASSVFNTKSKDDIKTIWGLQGLKTLVAQAKHPVIAIGGIKLSNIAAVMQTGVVGVAVISAIHDASDASLLIKQMRTYC